MLAVCSAAGAEGDNASCERGLLRPDGFELALGSVMLPLISLLLHACCLL
jgi:hypothetical protein